MPGTFTSPFSNTSPWNTPIDDLNLIYSDPNSIEDQQFYNASLGNTWATFSNDMVYDTPANAPVETWTYNLLNQTSAGGTFSTNGTIQIPTPANITFVGPDGDAVFSDPDGVHYWEVWLGSYNSQTGTYQASYIVEGNYVTGTGWGENGIGAGIRASGASLLGGIVTQTELNDLSIQHALAIVLAPTQLEAGTAQSNQIIYPAVSADSDSAGLYSGTIPMGAHFALPAGLDLADAGLTPEGLALAEAYQTYGGYVVDSAADTTSIAQIEGGTAQQISDIDADLSWIRDHLVMTSTVSQVGTTIESAGSTSLVQYESNLYLDNIISGSGPELKYAGTAVVAGEFGAWTAIAAERTASGYDVAWEIPGANEYSIWATDTNGNFTSLLIGPVFGNSPALESFETIFQQDLNGDGTIGIPTVVQASQSTSLVQSGTNYNLISGGSDPELKYAGVAVVAGQFGAWTPIAVVQTASGYDVAWKLSGADQYSVWATDDSGNFTSLLIGPVSGNSALLESFETTFQQDLNSDGFVGLTTLIEASGSTSLVQYGTNYYLESNSGGSSLELKDAGAAVVVGQFGAWTPIAVEQTASGYDVAWQQAGADQYSVWAIDSSGNMTSLLIGPVSGNSAALESFETTFHQDLNGDGLIGVTTVIKSSGSTSLVQYGNDFYLESNNGGSGLELKYSGAAVVVGQFGAWSPIAVEQTASGYDVAWQIPGSNQYSVWATDSSGNMTSLLIGPVSGNSVAFESFETTFHQDLNGDGHIGLVVAAGAVLELPGATSGVVTFSSSTGSLKLDTPSTFTGQITGFTGDGTLSGSDQIDLVSLSYNSSIQTNTTYNSSTGVLSVNNGTTADVLNFVGNYSLANFKFASDGNDGTIVYDPPVTNPGPSTAPANSDNFVFAPNAGQVASSQFKTGTDVKQIDHLDFASKNVLEVTHDDAHGFMTNGIQDIPSPHIIGSEHLSHQTDFHLV